MSQRSFGDIVKQWGMLAIALVAAQWCCTSLWMSAMDRIGKEAVDEFYAPFREKNIQAGRSPDEGVRMVQPVPDTHVDHTSKRLAR